MIYALNEVEATSRKAARGAGFAWGLAEEIGKAVRSLAAYGMPGPDLLLAHLTQSDRQTYEDWAPTSVEGTWQAKNGLLCPLISGITLCDHADRLVLGSTLNFGPIAFPLLILPFVARTAKVKGAPLLLEWPGVRARCGSGRLNVEAEPSDLRAVRAEYASCSAQADDLGGRPPGRDGRDIDETVWRGLVKFAHRTYVPATEESRLAGAGAGLRDND